MIPTAITISCITSIYGRADGFEWDDGIVAGGDERPAAQDFQTQPSGQPALQIPLEMQTFINNRLSCLNKKAALSPLLVSKFIMY